MKKFPALRAIVTAGVVVGILDISSAFVIWWQRGVALQHGLQGIAAGLLGTKSYEGGMATAALGLALHFFIAFVVVSIFYQVSRKVPFLMKQPLFPACFMGSAFTLLCTGSCCRRHSQRFDTGPLTN